MRVHKMLLHGGICPSVPWTLFSDVLMCLKVGWSGRREFCVFLDVQWRWQNPYLIPVTFSYREDLGSRYAQRVRLTPLERAKLHSSFKDMFLDVALPIGSMYGIYIYIYTCIIWVVKAPCWNRQGFLRRGLSCILIGRLSWRYHAIELTQTHWRQRRETIQRDDYANTSTQLLSAVHQAAASKAKISRPTWKARPSLLTQFVSAPGISHHLNGRCYGLTTLWGKWQRASPKHSTVTRKAQMPPDDVSKIQCMYKITWARNQNHQDETTSQSVEEAVL